jgi:predicted HTH domain antitoxin
MCDLIVSVPDARLAALKVPPGQAADEVRMLAAVKLYEMGRLSTGAAAEFAGIPKPVFLQRLGDYGAPVFDMTEEDFERETRLARTDL